MSTKAKALYLCGLVPYAVFSILMAWSVARVRTDRRLSVEFNSESGARIRCACVAVDEPTTSEPEDAGAGEETEDNPFETTVEPIQL